MPVEIRSPSPRGWVETVHPLTPSKLDHDLHKSPYRALRATDDDDDT